MPELPEVETVRRGLERHVVGRTIAAVEVLHPRAVRRHLPGAADFCAGLTGRRVLSACRRGKYLWFPLDSGDALLAHLGMSGQLLVVDSDTPSGPHLRVRFAFADGDPQLRFVDQRTFGGLALCAGTAISPGPCPGTAISPGPCPGTAISPGPCPGAGALPAEIAHIAPDPLDPGFDVAAFHTALRARRTGLKRALLDQGLVSGVGNIYADEALWRARLHYARPTHTMLRPVTVRLVAALRSVFADALAAGGTSFDRLYVNVNGESGYFDRALAVYGRRGEPCARCGTAIQRDSFMNRSSFFCPRCQPRPRTPHW